MTGGVHMSAGMKRGRRQHGWWATCQPDKAPPTCRPAGPAERPRPSRERGSGWLEKKKEWAAAGLKGWMGRKLRRIISK
jgi:hypothetical protein